MSSARRILVTDGEQRAALALVRALGRAGNHVYVAAPRRRSLAGSSRYARDAAAVPDPLREPDRFVDAVHRLAARWAIDVLLPVSEPALLAILPARDRFGAVLLPFPEAETFRRVADKAAVLAAAPRVGIAIPDQRTIRTRAEGAALDPAMLRFPLVLKPARSVAGEGSARAKLAVSHVTEPAQWATALDRLEDAAYPLLVQQRIVGPGVGIFLLLWGGRRLATFAHRRLREKPPAGGVSVYRESIPADPDLVARSQALLEQFDWCGVAMVEYKIDARTGTPYLMEVNGRFWGSLQLAIDAGVDFPVLLLAAASGEPVIPVTAYRTGVRSRWWWGDVDHLLSRLRRSREELALPPDAPGQWQVVREFLTVRRGVDREEILRWDDARPFLQETIEWFRRR